MDVVDISIRLRVLSDSVARLERSLQQQARASWRRLPQFDSFFLPDSAVTRVVAQCESSKWQQSNKGQPGMPPCLAKVDFSAGERRLGNHIKAGKECTANKADQIDCTNEKRY